MFCVDKQFIGQKSMCASSGDLYVYVLKTFRNYKYASFKFIFNLHSVIQRYIPSFIWPDKPISLCNTKAKPPIIDPIFICLCNGHSVLPPPLPWLCLQYKAPFLLTFVQLQLFM